MRTYAAIVPCCVVCNCIGDGRRALPVVLADALTEQGSLAPLHHVRGVYTEPTICSRCLSTAAEGDSAPSGVDMPVTFYRALTL